MSNIAWPLWHSIVDRATKWKLLMSLPAQKRVRISIYDVAWCVCVTPCNARKKAQQRLIISHSICRLEAHRTRRNDGLCDSCKRRSKPSRWASLSTTKGEIGGGAMNHAKRTRRPCRKRTLFPRYLARSYRSILTVPWRRTADREEDTQCPFLNIQWRQVWIPATISAASNLYIFGFFFRITLIVHIKINAANYRLGASCINFEAPKCTLPPIIAQVNVPDQHNSIKEFTLLLIRKWPILALLGRVLFAVVLAVAPRPGRRGEESGIACCPSLSSGFFLSPKHFAESANNTASQLCSRVTSGFRRQYVTSSPFWNVVVCFFWCIPLSK